MFSRVTAATWSNIWALDWGEEKKRKRRRRREWNLGISHKKKQKHT